MTTEEKGMRPIWFFVGLILTCIGGLIAVTGFVRLFTHTANTPLSNLHPDLWWGLLMVVIGLIFVWFTRNATVD